jgi:hypothetical protein
MASSLRWSRDPELDLVEAMLESALLVVVFIGPPSGLV